MNNYYFTASKWYGPLDNNMMGILYFKSTDGLEKFPSGDSLIPEFAGMVKEENKDFKFKLEQTIFVDQQQWQEMSRSEKDECFTKTAVPVAAHCTNKVRKMMDKLDEENSTENRYQKEYTESVEWVVALLDALGDLVEAKRIKEDSGETAEYLMLKDAAWYKAKTIIGAITTSKYFHNDFVYAMWKTYQIPNSKFGEDGRIKENNYLKITGPYLQVLPYVRALLSEDKTMWEKIKNLFKK